MAERVVVVGAGSAGCVVAARLSEDPATSVVLLEAGPDYPDVHAAPIDIRSGFVMGGTDHDWGYLSEPMATPDAAATPGSDAAGVVPVLRGKVVGGSSAVNGTSIMRSSPTDFAAWVAAGNPAWTWDAVLAAYRRLEADPLGGPAHGTDGPLPVHRFPVADMRPVHRAFLDAAAALGHPLIEDHNAPGSLGAGPIPLNQVDGIRQSAAVTHLLEARDRPNLTLRADVAVDRLELVDGAPRAVVLTTGERIECDRVVLSAGVYGSPSILLRSGVGPADELRALGIEPVLDQPHVGRHLRDHPMSVVAVEGDLDALGDLIPPVQTMLTLASDGSGDPAHLDVEVALMVTTPYTSEWFTAAPGTLLFGVALVRPRSEGRMALSSADPDAPPRIWLNFFDDPSDLDRILVGVDLVRDLIATPAMKPFVVAEQFPGPDVQGDALRELVQSATPSYAHGVGTCRMGPSAETAVVDQTGRVYGLRDVWVIDASIFPALPAVPTNSTTMVLAERCVAWLRGTEPAPPAP
jgi:choline dehydrogenase